MVCARSSAEKPSSVSAVTSAPFASNRSTIAALPDEAAYISGVAPSSFRLSMSIPTSTSMSIISEMAADAGQPQRVVAVGISRIHLGTCHDQQANDIAVPAVGCLHQRRRGVGDDGVDSPAETAARPAIAAIRRRVSVPSPAAAWCARLHIRRRGYRPRRIRNRRRSAHIRGWHCRDSSRSGSAGFWRVRR